VGNDMQQRGGGYMWVKVCNRREGIDGGFRNNCGRRIRCDFDISKRWGKESGTVQPGYAETTMRKVNV